MRPAALLLALLVLVGCSSPGSRRVEDRVAGETPAVSDTGGENTFAAAPEGGRDEAVQRADRRLAELREEFSFSIFVPTRVPEGLEPRPPLVRDDRVVEIAYLASDLWG